MHMPDPLTPIEETLAVLTDLVQEGKVRYLGSSNFAGWQVLDADWTAQTSGLETFVSDQSEYSWLSRGIEAELVPALEHTGKGLLPYFPLASGLLTGKYKRGADAPAGQPARRAARPGGGGRLRHDRGAGEVRGRPRASRCSRSPSAGWPRCRPSVP